MSKDTSGVATAILPAALVIETARVNPSVDVRLIPKIGWRSIKDIRAMASPDQ